MATFLFASIFLFFGIFLFFMPLNGANVGDVITNQANASYTIASNPKTVLSNEINTTVSGTTPIIEFLRHDNSGSNILLLGASSYQDTSSSWIAMPPPMLANGTILSTISNESFSHASNYNVDDLSIIKLQDVDRNTNPLIRETVQVTVTSPSGDIETIALIETDVSSGVFTGYLPLTATAGVTKNGRLYVRNADMVRVAYEDQSSIVVAATAVISSSTQGNIWIEKSVNKTSAGIGDTLKYTIRIHNENNFNAYDTVWYDKLPHGIKYQAGTLKVDGVFANPTVSMDGKELSLNIPLVNSKGYSEITFLAIIGAIKDAKEIVNNTWAIDTNGIKTNIATATTILKEELYQSSGFVVGQVYDSSYKDNKKGKGVANVRLYLENGTYVLTDENGKYHFEGLSNGTHVVQIDKSMLPKGYEIESCSLSNKFSGNNFSQFIDLKFGGLKRADFCLKKTDPNIGLQNPKCDTNKTNACATEPKDDKMPIYTADDIKNHNTEILWPPKDYVPSIPAISLSVRYPKNHKAELWLNGAKVSMLNFDGKIISPNEVMVIDRYKGVDLLNGSNKIEIKLFDVNNNLYNTLFDEIFVANTPVKMVYMPELSKIVANGIEPCVIAVKMFDSSNKPIRAGMTGVFSVNAPYRSMENIEQLKNNPLAKIETTTKYTVGKDGIAYIALQPTTQSGEVTFNFPLGYKNEVIKAWLKPSMREWIMVGFTQGSIGYDTLKKKAQGSSKKELITEGQASFFAKGTIKGEWLTTIAYNSGKDTKNQKYFGTIDQNSYYTVYNDNSEQNYDAPSTKKLYVKLEKDEFNILFGDFNTDFTTTELSQYSRTFTGLKSEYHGDNIHTKAFAAYTDQVFQRDEIRGKGTSGYYYLKNKPVVENSETVTIETRDRYRNEIVISEKQLARYKDYNIDHALGRLYFKEPIYSNDANFNPQYIIVKYEVKGDGSKHYTYGARVIGKTKDGDVEVGSTFVNEDIGTQKNTLLGIDAKIRITPNTTARAEYAASIADKDGKSLKGDAKFAEIEHLSDGLYARGYYREQDNSFGLGQLSGDLNGTRKIGFDAVKTFDNRMSLRASGYRNSDTKTDNNEDVLEIKAQIDETLWSLYAGYRYAKNSDTDAANQILLGGSYALFDQRLRLLGAIDKTIGANKDELFPDRTMIGVNYSLTSNAEVFGSYEWLKNDDKDSEQGRIGTRYTPWGGMSIESCVLSEFKNDTARLYNTTGMTQSYQVTPKIWLSAGYEKGTMIDGNATKESDEFDAYRLGGNYRGELFSATINSEFKDGSLEKTKNFALGVYTQPNDDMGLAFNTLYSRTYDDVNNSESIDASLTFAYRPQDAKWIVFDKLEYVYEKENGNENYDTQKLINNLQANYMPNDDFELSLQYGLKYVFDTIDEFEYDGFVELFGIDARYEVADKIDIGVQGSAIVAHNAGNIDYGAGVYIGYNIFDNLWINLGYNFAGFDDDDFSLQTYRHQGPYIKLRMKFDQENIEKYVKALGW
jgi:uncharacterized repeat protein (TIGR01451 family)